MDVKMIFLFCLCDKFLKDISYHDDSQCQISTAEIMAFAITTALFFQGNYHRARLMLITQNYFRKILSLSRINRRIHIIPSHLWQQILLICRYIFSNPHCQEYIVDSFPVPVCQNCRILRCKLFPVKDFHGYCANKQMYFLGIKVHLIVLKDGVPIECVFTSGSESDIKALK